jgi:uncharacterized protein YijF (DUF1287 family)
LAGRTNHIISARRSLAFAICLIFTGVSGCREIRQRAVAIDVAPPATVTKSLPLAASLQLKQLLEGAVAQSTVTTGYDPSYVKLDYPNGDVDARTGVCSDVVVRAFRKAGLDLQKEVHEDMKLAWAEYPKKWGAQGTDSNIDHRRVLNLNAFFTRQKKSLPISANRNEYLPGDVVAWELSDGVEHIGIMTDHWSVPDEHCLVIHNIGAGARMEDVLFTWKIIGHYRYFDN